MMHRSTLIVALLTVFVLTACGGQTPPFQEVDELITGKVPLYAELVPDQGIPDAMVEVEKYSTNHPYGTVVTYTGTHAIRFWDQLRATVHRQPGGIIVFCEFTNDNETCHQIKWDPDGYYLGNNFLIVCEAGGKVVLYWFQNY